MEFKFYKHKSYIFFAENEQDAKEEFHDYFGYHVNLKEIDRLLVEKDFKENANRIMLIKYHNGEGIFEEVLEEIYNDDDCYNVILCD